MSTENPAPESNNKAGRLAAPTLIQAAFPEKPTVVFFTAIVIGLFLISMTTIFPSYFAVNYLQSNLVLCLGVGLILAAFGGQATVRIGGIIMAGVAAVTLGLFIYLQHESPRMFLQGRISRFDSDTYQSLQIRQKNFILGRVVAKKNPKQSYYDFAIFQREIQGQIFTVELEEKSRKKPVIPEKEPVIPGKERSIEVRAAHFTPAFGRPEMLDWELREEGEGSDRILCLYDRLSGTRIAREDEPAFGKSATKRTPIVPALFNVAFAEERSDIDVPLMLERLKADDTATRRGARDALSQAPVESIPTIMETLRLEGANYRVKLGICVALAEMLSAKMDLAKAISSKLKEDDLNRMLDAAGDPDRTVRVYAGRFLFLLGDPRTTKLAIPRAAKTSDKNARHNWLLISQRGWPELSREEKAGLETQLNEAKRRSGSNTETLKLFEKLQIEAREKILQEFTIKQSHIEILKIPDAKLYLIVDDIDRDERTNITIFIKESKIDKINEKKNYDKEVEVIKNKNIKNVVKEEAVQKGDDVTFNYKNKNYKLKIIGFGYSLLKADSMECQLFEVIK